MSQADDGVDRQPGDPEGRRLAAQRAARLAEAAALARALRVLLVRAAQDLDLCDQIIEAVGRNEGQELQRAYGRVEPRRRFRAYSSQPLLDNRPIYNLFLDESGKSFAENRDAPTFFSIGGVAMTDDAVSAYCEEADKLKLAFFKTTEITFHEPLMRRHDGPYFFGGDPARQAGFDHAIDELLEGTEFVVFGVGIRKHGFEQEFVETGIDPYLPTDAYAVAIMILLERFLDCLATHPTRRMGRVTFESQGTLEDAQHQLEYARLLLDGSQWVPDSSFRQWLETGCRFVPKAGSHPTEIADMVSRDLFEWIRDGCCTSPRFWPLISRRVYIRGDGKMGKFGIKVFPDADLRGLIEEHRAFCLG